MLLRSFRSAPLLAPFALCLSLTPALAQETSAKDAWDALREAALGAGLVVSSAGIDQDGAALIVRDLRLQGAEDVTDAHAHFPFLRIEPRGAEGVALTLPDGASLHGDSAAFEQRRFALEAAGAMLMGFDDSSLRLAPQFDSLRLTLAEASRDGRPLDERFDMSIDGLAGQLHITAEPGIDAEGQLRADRIAYGFFQDDTRFIDMLRDEEAEIIAPALTFEMHALHLLDGGPAFLARAFAGGMSARIGFEAEASSSRSTQHIDGMELSFAGAGGRSEGLLELDQGMLRLSGESHGGQFTGEGAGFAGEASLAHAASSMQLPLIATDDDRPFGLRITLSGVEASNETWAMLGAGGMAGDSADLALEVTGHGRWLYEITDEPPLEDEPFDLVRLALDELTLRFGNARLDGSGQFVLEPGSLMSPEPFEQGSGDFVFNLNGGEALLTRLAGEGLLPADQQFLARMMLSALGRPIGEDQLRSEIAIRPGGQILVNGLPLPF